MSPRKKGPVKPTNRTMSEAQVLKNAVVEKDERQRMKNISSVAANVDGAIRDASRRIEEIDRKISSTAARARGGVNREIIEARKSGDTGTREVTRSVTKILDKLGLTIAALSKGIASITAATARATKEAVQEYGRAIGEDISINKQNVVAMALARTSPLFGYFVSKIFETSILRNAMAKFKSSISNAFSSIRKPKALPDEFFEEANAPVSTKVRRGRRRAEMSAQEESVEYLKNMEHALTSKGTVYVKDVEVRKNIRSMENSLLAIRDAILEQQESFEGGLETFFAKHPHLVNMYTLFMKIKGAMIAPFKFFFKIRGGYKTDLPKGPNVFQNIYDVLALTYTAGMHKLDIIIEYLKRVGEYITKTELKEPKEKRTFTIFGEIMKFFGKGGEGDIKKKRTLQDWVHDFAERHDLDEESMNQALGLLPARYRVQAEKLYASAKEFKDRVAESLGKIASAVIQEGPFAAFRIAKGEASERTKELKEKTATVRKSAKEKLETFGWYKKMTGYLKGIKGDSEALPGELNKGLKKSGKGLWDLVKTGLMMLVGFLGKIFAPILNLFKGGGALKNLGGMFGRGAGGAGKLGMGKGLSIGGGALAGIWSGYEMGKKRGVAAGIAQGAISGSLSTIGGLILGPLGTVLGKMLGDALGKYAFKLGDWLAEHFNIFSMIQDYIITPISNFFSSIGSGIKKLLGIKEKLPEGIVPGSYAEKGLKLRAEGKIKFGAAPTDVQKGPGTQTGREAGVKTMPGVDVSGVKPPLWQNFTAMAGEYKDKTGNELQLNSAFRSREKQEELYKTNPYAAPPGRSPHEKGRALDINSEGANQLAGMGLMEKYGFYRPMTNEPWHLQNQAVGDPKFRAPFGTKDVVAMQGTNEMRSTQALLQANKDLGSTVASGLEGVKNNIAAGNTNIINTMNTSMNSSSRGDQGGSSDSDPDIERVISGDLS